MRDRVAVINVAWSEVKSKQFSWIIDDQMQFKAIKPARGGFAPLSEVFEHFMPVNTTVVANGNGGDVNKGHKALIAHEPGKLPFKMASTLEQIIAFEITLTGLMKMSLAKIIDITK